eukprot:TRINITY_DN12113_c0_g3_i11.p1 TRINITY_DN12113_c0_g3~~TRINITY_DN12113_c0_g3_i11.p1  ORF type:complete len:206 (-),score=62.76 TRINITY_DN12113_c0_g3_i11:177-794(-)
MEQPAFDATFWNIRGFVIPIKMIMEYLHVSVEALRADLDSMPPITLTPEDWPEIKEQLLAALTVTPTDGHNFSITQGLWICRFLAQKYNPKMLGSAMNEYAEVDTVLYICCDLRALIISSACDAKAMEVAREKLGLLNKMIRGRAWISGKQATVADFVFFELVELLQYFCENVLDGYPHCKRVVKKLGGIPEVVKYRKMSEPSSP